MKKWIKMVLFVIICLGILWLTLYRSPGKDHKLELRVFWSYREMLIGDPNWKKDVLQNIQNILLFIPFGLLFPSSHFQTVFFYALVFSVGIELAQYVFMLGLAEIDDVISNVLGSMIGYWTAIRIRKNLKIPF